VGQDAAFEEGVELDLNELRQFSPGGRLCLGDEDRGVLLHEAVQRGLFRAAYVANGSGAGIRGRWPNGRCMAYT